MNKILFFRRNNKDLNIKFWNFKNIFKNVKLLFYTNIERRITIKKKMHEKKSKIKKNPIKTVITFPFSLFIEVNF